VHAKRYFCQVRSSPYLHFLNMIDIVIIVGAASGVIVFNFILVTWCLFCHRKQGPTGTKVELRTIALQKRSSLLKGNRTVRFAASVKDSRNKYASYPASTRRLPLPYVPSPLVSAKVRTRRSDRPRAENLFPHKLSTTVPTITNHASSVRSDDTASVYSTASAPLEYHDYLLRSHISPNTILVTSASSPSEMLSTVSSRNASCSGNCLTVMEEGLIPKAAIQQRPRQASRRWRQQQSVSREMSRDQSAWNQIPNPMFPPGLPPTAQKIKQGPSSTPSPSPYSPPSKW
jgi:hypothetical protein